MTYADASASGTVNDSDTFTFTGGVDIVAGSGFSVTGITGDKINLAAGPNQYGLGSMALPAAGLANNQQYFLARGNLSGELHGQYDVWRGHSGGV